MIKKFSIRLGAGVLSLAWALKLGAAPFGLGFWPSPSETNGIVQGYSMWIQTTNPADANRWQWIGQCSAGQTNIIFDSTNLVYLTNGLSNPVWITATANGTNGQASSFATPILFDTNDYPVLPVVITNLPPRLIPPTLLSVQRL